MKERLLAFARHARLLTFTGLRQAFVFDGMMSSEWRGQRLLILCYHGVSLADEHEWLTELFVTPTFLRRRFEILKTHGYNVLRLEDAVRLLQDRDLPPKSVVLTFDDGFFNFKAAAVPVLQEFEFPATNYVSSYYVVNQRPLLDLTIDYLLWSARKKPLAAGTFRGQGSTIDSGDKTQRAYLRAQLISEAKGLEDDREAQSKWLETVAHRLEVDWEGVLSSRILHLMSADELSLVAAQGFDIQLHTHRHRTPRNEKEFCAEIVENRRILEQCTGRPAKHFCYPSGDVDEMFLPWLTECGVESATTGVSRLANPSDNTLLLPRYVDTMHQTEIAFESWLCGIADFLTPRRRIGI